ncbi:MAG: exodeoxyribonuclease VII large subunit [bacterium]
MDVDEMWIARNEATGEITLGRRLLDALATRLVRQSPAARVAGALARVDALRPRLARAVAQRLASSRTEVSYLERRLRSAGPEETLARGYAILTDEKGALVRSVSAAGARAGARMTVQVADGAIPVRVEQDGRKSGAES